MDPLGDVTVSRDNINYSKKMIQKNEENKHRWEVDVGDAHPCDKQRAEVSLFFQFFYMKNISFLGLQRQK